MALTYKQMKDRIVELEDVIKMHGNAARDALLEQGDLLRILADRKNGDLGTIADEVGIGRKAAEQRRDGAVAANPPIRSLLAEYSDVYLAYGALLSIINKPNGARILEARLAEARANGQKRVTRDQLRADVGMRFGTVGSPRATADRISRDPGFADALTRNGVHVVSTSKPGNLLWKHEADRALLMLGRVVEHARLLDEQGKAADAAQVRDYLILGLERLGLRTFDRQATA